MTPLAELHVHLEGTAPPALVRRLAARNGIAVAPGTLDGDRYVWRDFLDFLRTYDRAAATVRTAQDYRDVTFAYLDACAAEGAIYVELTASPDHAAEAGLPYADMVAGIAQGIDDADRRRREPGHRHRGARLRARSAPRRSPAPPPSSRIPT